MCDYLSSLDSFAFHGKLLTKGSLEFITSTSYQYRGFELVTNIKNRETRCKCL